ncbi:ENTH domain protein [Paecilomyces variotii No. 5]|uniref:ENTH domain protein n=1 Tax=Byssochlamys spectabilis (strain No. 5 / NBRC 109023) TaxID=1356009 RepID=V5FSH0_BYSSN|nr:ENTH domain protein [Paecilomyces variotii No. 5]
MSTNFEKSVKGATKIKLAAPKSKYIEHILIATHAGEAGVAEIFRTLQFRFRDSTWTIVFKALIVVHLMIREGEQNATLQYLAEYPKKIAISTFSEVQSQGHNIRRYSEYLIARARAFADTRVDYVRSGPGRLKRLTVDKGLLRETEIVQKQIRALLRCDLLTDEVENEITLTAFRLLTLDLLVLYSVMNEGTINVLEHYFEMSRPDSERALLIYKTFTTQTEEVVKFLGVARHFEAATRLEIPKLKHASTDLTRLLEDDLNDPDFDLRRREYLAQKEAKKGGRGGSSAPTKSTGSTSRAGTSHSSSKPEPAAPKQESKGPPPDLIDFFESIEQNQQPMAQPGAMQQPNFQQPQMQFQQTGFQPQPSAFYPQQTGYAQQPQQTGFGQQPAFGGPFGQSNNTNPFGQQQQQAPQPLQPTPTGAGFGGYTPQPQPYGFQHTGLSSIPQDGIASFSQQQQQQQQPPPPPQPLQPMPTGTNPFRQSTLMPTPTGNAAFGSQAPATSLSRQNTNPFARRMSVNPQLTGANTSPFASPPQFQQQNQTLQPPTQPFQPLQPQQTGTNPFSRPSTAPPQQQPGLQPPAAAPLRPNPTGSTNPFRQSTFVNQQTGQGWHVSGQQGTMGSLENLDTVPVFPRPGLS